MRHRGFTVRSLCLAALLVLLLAACSSSRSIAGIHGEPTLVGNPDFSSDALSPDAQVWYRRFLFAATSGQQYPDANELAATGNLYDLGRFVNVHISTVLAVFRVTGDLRLLDQVDALMQRARGALSDGDGDGYLNWRWLQIPSNSEHYGRDVHIMDETMTHGMVAAVAWTFESNRELVSPAGIDYGERADFWRSYLVEHFEPKWRERTRRPLGFDYLHNELMHPYMQGVRYSHYMALLTGEDGHRLRAEQLAAALAFEFRVVETDQGRARVWGQGVLSAGSYVTSLQPMIYAGYTVLTAYELGLEGVAPFSDPTFLAEISRGLVAFAIDNGAEDFAVDVGGNRPRAGLDPAPLQSEDPWGFVRMTDQQFAIQAFGVLAPFDSTGTLSLTSRDVYLAIETPERPRRIYLPATLFLGLVSP